MNRGHPLSRDELARRARPFMLAGTTGIAVALFPFTPARTSWTVGGVGALLVISAATYLLPWERWPRWLAPLPGILSCGALGALMVGEESVRASLIPLFLLPVLWNALYDRFSETAVVIGVAVATPAVVGRYFGIQDTGDTVQPLVVWTVVAGLIAFSVQSVRAELTSALRSREDMIKRTAMVDLAAAELYSSLNPDAVVGVGLRAAAHLAVGPEGLRKESYFFTLEQDAVTLMAHYREQSDDTEPERSFQLEDVPVLRRAAEQTAPITFGAGYAATRNDESETAHSLGILGGIAISTRIPEMSEMGLTGVLVVSGGEQGRFTRDNVQQLTSFVTIFELALSRALKHAADATTDPLTGLTNRREFTRRLHTMPRGDAYALLTMQVDGLDVVNKTAGRPAGDELLVAVAAALHRSVRASDIVARSGADEFCALLPHGDAATARLVAERMVKAVEKVQALDHPARLTVGCALVQPGEDPRARLTAAQALMLKGRTSGGLRVLLDGEATNGVPRAKAKEGAVTAGWRSRPAS